MRFFSCFFFFVLECACSSAPLSQCLQVRWLWLQRMSLTLSFSSDLPPFFFPLSGTQW